MTRIFLADQKHLREKRDPTEISEKTDVRQKKDEQSWGDTMGSIFKFIKWIGRHRIYRMNKIGPINILNGWGHLVGYLFFGRSHKVQKRIRRSIRALYPNASEKWIKKVSLANAKYMGMLLLDIVFRLPQTCDFKEGDKIAKLPCGHIFDAESILKWLKKEDARCPVCRKKLPSKEVKRMECKECKIVCDGKEVATINCSEEGFSLKCTEEGKKLRKEFKCGCC